MEMMMLMSQGIGMMSTLVYALLWTIPLVYVVLRWRAYRDGGPADPQLGLKVLLHAFQSYGLFTALIGIGCILYALLPPASNDQVLRIGLPLLIIGGVVFFAHAVVIARRTNSAAKPMVSRTFAGINFAVTGTAGFLSAAALLVSVFQPGDTGDAIRVCLSIALVAVPAWVLHGFLFFRRCPAAVPAEEIVTG
jgi:hypothetical protein